MFRRLACSLVIVFAAAGPLRAQSPLVEAAKRAEENSAANTAYTPSFSNATLNSADPIIMNEAALLQLTMESLRNVVKAVDDVRKAYDADKDLAQRMSILTTWARSVAETERGYIREPALAAALRAHNLTARQYIITQFAFQLALTANKDPQMAKAFEGRGKVTANVRLIRANQKEIDVLTKRLDESLAKP
jgi:hypothetical protein